MERLKGFMIMPYMAENETQELTKVGTDKCDPDIVKKKLCLDFFETIVKEQCGLLGVDIELAKEIDDSQNSVENVIKAIKERPIIVVDLTLFRPSVMYELGIAHCIDPHRTLLITQDDYSEIPFDIRPYNIIQYDSTNAKFIKNIKKNLESLIKHHFDNEICLGVSPFPELTILIPAMADNKYNLAIREVSWDETFKHFDRGQRVDLIIANHEKCNILNSEGNTNYIYKNDLIKYNSFYLISKNLKVKSFKELHGGSENIKDCVIRTLNQFNEFDDKQISIYASEKTDHAQMFRKFNGIFGNQLINNYSLKGGDISAVEIFRDFIRSEEAAIYIGGIPERIKLLKNSDYKLIIEYNDFKYDESLKSIRNYLQQANGIVYNLDKVMESIINTEKGKERRKSNPMLLINDIVKFTYESWRKAFQDIIALHSTGEKRKIEEYLKPYNDSNYVKSFKNCNGIDLTISADDFILNYIDNGLISINNEQY